MISFTCGTLSNWAHSYREHTADFQSRCLGQQGAGIVIKRYKFSVLGEISSGDITYNMITTVNNTVLHIWKLLRDLKSPHHKKNKFLTRSYMLPKLRANLENSAVATGLEKVSFHSKPKEGQSQRMLKLPHNCTHLIR